MASGMYTYGLTQMMRGNIDLINDAVSVVLCSTSYTPDLTSDQNQIDIPEAARLGEVELAGNILDGTTFKSNSATIQEPTENETANAAIVFLNSGDYGTSTLIAYFEIDETVTDGTPFVIDAIDGWFEL